MVIIQDDRFEDLPSVTVCPFTSDPTDAPLFRPLVEASPRNGLRQPSRLMVDKITMRRNRLGQHLGSQPDQDMIRLQRSMILFLGLAG